MTTESSETDLSGADSPRRSAIRIVVQLMGFALGLVLLGWTAREALKPENREQLASLRDASPGLVALLFGCSLVTLLINGLIFWAVLRPEKKLPVSNMVATNAFTTMLAYLPFKLSLFARIALHNRRDGVPLLTIAAWFGAVGVLIFVAMGPVAGASLWRKGVDLWWWIGSLGGVGVLLAAMIVISGVLAHRRGLERIHAVTDPLRIGPVNRFLRTDSFGKMHGVFGMLAHPWASVSASALRLADIGVLTLRFLAAAWILDVELGWEAAVLFASTYFMIGMLSPFGMLGPREAGSIGVAELLGFADAGESLAVVILIVTASESLAYLFGGMVGAVWIRPDRLVRGAKSAAEL